MRCENVVDRQRPGAGMSAVRPTAVSQARRRVLVVDSDTFLQRAVEAALRRGGFDVVAAVDGEAALSQSADTELPHLVVLDLILPQMSGFELLRRLKQNSVTAAITVIVFSDLGSERDAKETLGAGATDHLVGARFFPTRVEKFSSRSRWR